MEEEKGCPGARLPVMEAAPPSIGGGFKGEKSGVRITGGEREKARQTKSVRMEKRSERIVVLLFSLFQRKAVYRINVSINQKRDLTMFKLHHENIKLVSPTRPHPAIHPSTLCHSIPPPTILC